MRTGPADPNRTCTARAVELQCGCSRPPCHGLHAPRVTVYRVAVFGQVWRRGRIYKGRRPARKGAYTTIESIGAGWISWTPDTTAEPWRAGYGSFGYAGGVRAVQAARAALRDPRVTQVQIRTNQDRTIIVYNRRTDGSVSFYDAAD